MQRIETRASGNATARSNFSKSCSNRDKKRIAKNKKRSNSKYGGNKWRRENISRSRERATRSRRSSRSNVDDRCPASERASVCFVTRECVVFVLVVFSLFDYPFFRREFVVASPEGKCAECASKDVDVHRTVSNRFVPSTSRTVTRGPRSCVASWKCNLQRRSRSFHVERYR